MKSYSTESKEINMKYAKLNIRYVTSKKLGLTLKAMNNIAFLGYLQWEVVC